MCGKIQKKNKMFIQHLRFFFSYIKSFSQIFITQYYALLKFLFFFFQKLQKISLILQTFAKFSLKVISFFPIMLPTLNVQYCAKAKRHFCRLANIFLSNLKPQQQTMKSSYVNVTHRINMSSVKKGVQNIQLQADNL